MNESALLGGNALRWYAAKGYLHLIQVFLTCSGVSLGMQHAFVFFFLYCSKAKRSSTASLNGGHSISSGDFHFPSRSSEPAVEASDRAGGEDA